MRARKRWGTRRGPKSCKPWIAGCVLHDLSRGTARYSAQAEPFGRLGVRGSQVQILSARRKIPALRPPVAQGTTSLYAPKPTSKMVSTSGTLMKTVRRLSSMVPVLLENTTWQIEVLGQVVVVASTSTCDSFLTTPTIIPAIHRSKSSGFYYHHWTSEHYAKRLSKTGA